MNYLRNLKKTFTPSYALVSAINDGTNEDIVALINLGVDVEQGCGDNSLSPLQAALLNKRYEICSILLERGASPNRPYYLIHNNKNTLTKELYRGELSNVKILLIYGAEISDNELGKIVHIKNDSQLKDFVLKYRDACQIKNQLLESMKAQHGDELCDTYRRLQAFWLEQAIDETNAVYKQHYQKRAHEYLSLYIELSTLLSSKHCALSDTSKHTNDKHFDFETKEGEVTEKLLPKQTKLKHR